MALNQPTPLNSFFRVNQLGLSLMKKILTMASENPQQFSAVFESSCEQQSLIVSSKQNVSSVFPVGVLRSDKFMCMSLISSPSPSSVFSNGFSSISFCLWVTRCNSGFLKKPRQLKVNRHQVN